MQAALAVIAMATSTSTGEHLEAVVPVPSDGAIGLGFRGKIGRRSGRSGFTWSPLLSNTECQDFDLPVRQMSALARRKCRHERAGASFAYDALQLRVRRQGEEQPIVERRRWTQLALGSVATDAILLEQDAECHLLLGRHVLVSRLWFAREVA